MASPSHAQDNVPIAFYIGHHETNRAYPVTNELLRFAQEDCNYDMLTAPITTNAFKSRVLSALSSDVDLRENTSNFAADDNPPAPILSSLTPADTNITPGNIISQLILTTSPWIDLASPDPLIAEISRQVLSLELQYASFCGANNVMIVGPQRSYKRNRPDGVSLYARAIQEALKFGPFINIHVLLPITRQDGIDLEKEDTELSTLSRKDFGSHLISGNGPDEDVFDTWDVWNSIRTVCRYNSRLSVALTLTLHVPPQSLQSRWYSEPLRILHIPGTSFHQTTRGEASLSQQHKHLVSRYMGLKNPPWILLSNVGALHEPQLTTKSPGIANDISSTPSGDASNIRPSSLVDPTPAEASSKKISLPQGRTPIGSHLRYMRQLQRDIPPKTMIESFGTGYQDYLQNPLQPLSDNLESITYEVFEKDPVKYDWYERAIGLALHDWQSEAKAASGIDNRVVLAVVGAGRGPLVDRAFRASANTGVEIDLWAVEKNPNAFVLLQRYNVERWGQRVNLVQSDMRTWTGPFFYTDLSSATQNSQATPNTVRFHVDILVSELLGSFGDNELSPECIDGVQHLLNPEYGISIPSSYTAHLTPIAAPKLHADVLARAASGDHGASQVPYVVMLQAIDALSTTPLPKHSGPDRSYPDTTSALHHVPTVLKAWSFSHPRRTVGLTKPTRGLPSNNNEHNRRFARLNYHCRDRGVCHGLGGYFEAVLYNYGNPTSHIMHSNGEDESFANQNNSRAYPMGRVELSTNPLNEEEKSKDMISWFPMFFPLKVPLYFPDNSLLSVSIWRQTDGRKVWYEWMVESFMLLDISPDGDQRVEHLGITELHSSFSSGCLL